MKVAIHLSLRATTIMIYDNNVAVYGKPSQTEHRAWRLIRSVAL